MKRRELLVIRDAIARGNGAGNGFLRAWTRPKADAAVKRRPAPIPSCPAGALHRMATMRPVRDDVLDLTTFVREYTRSADQERLAGAAVVKLTALTKIEKR
jgi:hypothetical protein